ncbi:MAG: rRNA maturation RNase YbeY [Hyphomicrobiaceae bacterium]|nr:rRNA maturation RNase YbeY [Hyphomicrobiaceae bacterium]
MTGSGERRSPAGGPAQEAEPDGGGEDTPQTGGLLIDIVADGGDWAFVPDVEAVVMAAAQAAARFPQSRLSGASAAVALSSDTAVSTLNTAYRGQPKSTNVLSFPAFAAARQEHGAERFIGDVVLAAGTIAAEAADQGIPPVHHLQHLVIHGLLHLTGYDHQTDAEAEAMETLEATILASLGITDPYAEDGADPPR